MSINNTYGLFMENMISFVQSPVAKVPGESQAGSCCGRGPKGTAEPSASAQEHFQKHHWPELAPSGLGWTETHPTPPTQEKYLTAFIHTIERVNQPVFFHGVSLLGGPEAVVFGWQARKETEQRGPV